jgi:hypothetical protein
MLFFLSFFLLPTSYDFYEKLTNFHPHSNIVYSENGVNLISQNSDSKLYEWILTTTDKKDIFIDSTLQIPVLGQRQLYIGVDQGVGQPGYSMAAETILKDVNGYDTEKLNFRWNLIHELFDINNPLSKDVVQKIVDSQTEGKIYLVSRNLKQREKFMSSALVREVFRNGDISAFLLKQ